MLNHFTEDGDDIEANLTFVADAADIDVGKQLLTDEAFARLFAIAHVPDGEADQEDGAGAIVDGDDDGLDQGPDA